MVTSVLIVLLAACDRDPGDAQRDPTSCVGCGALPETTRFARLTHLQWENTVQDLLGLPEPSGLSANFIGDRLAEGFDNDAEGLQVGPELWVDHQRAAEALAAQVVGTSALYTGVVPQDPRNGGGGPTETFTVQGEDPAAVTTTGGSAGSAWNLWSAGDLTATFQVPTAGTWLASARVWADQAGPDLARATLSVDGTQLLAADVSATTEGGAELLSAEATLSAGTHTVTVSFENDYYEGGADRNLYVDWVTVEGGGGGGSGAPPGDTERDAWLAAFGERVHRRPLSSTELAEYGALFTAAAEFGTTGDPFRDGVQLVLTAMLQSPQFVYRTEESLAQDAAGRIALTDWEVASKLSYALWNTMPDDALFEAARDGRLSTDEGLRAEALRLLADGRAHATLADLHRQLLYLDNYQNITKSLDLYPEFTPTMPASMQAEAYAFVDDVIFSDGSIHELYTRPSTFVNAELAPIYGLSDVRGDELVKVDLDPTQRAGLLTLSGFLALEADSYVHSPIRRGVFMNFSVLCTDLPPPPINVPPLPPSNGLQTTRDRVDTHTGPGTCGAACHGTLINPLGFGFEHYDALGRWQDEEFGMPVNSEAAFDFSDGKRAYADAVELSGIVGDSFDAHKCYTKHLVEYLQGRHVAPSDDALLSALARQSLQQDQPILDLVVELVLTDQFRFRSPSGGE
jgi:hypothetical protein